MELLQLLKMVKWNTLNLCRKEESMNDKVNVKIIVPEINESYDVLLPINKKIGTIVKLLIKAVHELSNNSFPNLPFCKLYNVDTMQVYDWNLLLYNTDIRNGTRLVLFSR